MDTPRPGEHPNIPLDLIRLPKRQKVSHSGDLPTLRLRHESYTIAWICALPIEMAAARAVLDNIHESLPTPTYDSNTYLLGNIQGHNVVIACLPNDQYGIINAANVVTNMRRTFPAIRVGLMVGIGGGVPSKVDVRLGDIVVGTRVMQADLGRIMADEQFERTATPRIPHQLLGTAVANLRAKHEVEPSRVPSILQLKLEGHGYGRPTFPDRLFQVTYRHEDPTAGCDKCDHSKLAPRCTRMSNDPVVHYGAIASGSQVIKNSVFRDEVARQLNVICFEMEAAGLMDILPCLPIRGICDYSDSHKSKEWQRYAAATAAAYARELVEELPLSEGHSREAEISTPDRFPSQERAQGLLNSLRFDQVDARKSNIKMAHGKTCRWFLNHPDYQAWLDSQKLARHHGFLWITGKPGAGKSTIMKFAYLKTKKKGSQRGGVTASFFFNARGEYLEKSVTGMYRSLLLQLFQGYPDLQTILDDPELWPTHTSTTGPSLNVLKALLSEAVSVLGQRSFTCFIDALDECDEQQVLDMIQYFEDLAQRSTAKGVALRICFSSRHYPYIIIRRGTRLILEDQSGHGEDLEAYIRGQLRAEDPDIIQRILKKAAGVFMWVVLVVDILNREYARGAMSLGRRLEELPSDLSALFKDILRRDSQNMEELLLCFLWILCAEHPLQPGEFYHAMWSGLSLQGLVDRKKMPDGSIQDINDGLSRSEKYVISCSKGFAEVTKSNKPSVQFIHESVRDFLIKDRGLYELWPELGFDWESPSHDKLKHCCHVYLTEIGPSPPLRMLDERKEDSNAYPFAEYASQCLLYHANAASKGVPQDNFLSSFHLKSWIEFNNLFEKAKVREYTSNANLFYVLADKGCPELIRTRLKSDPEIHVLGERYKYPLFAALARADKASFAALLNLSSTIVNGVDITEGFNHRKDLEGYKNRTPLSWAVENCREGIVKLLLQTGMDVNQVDPDRQTPISRALKNGHEAVAKLLLGRGADLNTKDRKGQTPFLQASENCSETMIRLLIDRGAHINADDNSGRRALHHVSQRGFAEVVTLLLDRGAEVNARTKSRKTALHYASEQGNEAVVRILIDYGADINDPDKYGKAALDCASQRGYEGIVKLLIKEGAEVKTEYQRRVTALHWASRLGHERAVKLLIEKGADLNAKNDIGQTSLHLASVSGHEGLVKLLIEEGADVNISDNFGQTALHRASDSGHEGLVKLLIKEGAEVNTSNNSGQTALHNASKIGQKAVVILLIARGALINTIDEYGWTALDEASERGHKAVVRLLINNGGVTSAADRLLYPYS